MTAEPRVYLVPFPVDENKALGIAYGKCVEDDLIDERVDGCSGSDSECE